MHELSICNSIFDSLKETLTPLQVRNLKEIHLKIGILSGIEPLLLQNAFELLTSEGPFYGVKLSTETVPLRAYCDQCGRSFSVEEYRFICPVCDNPSGRILEGRELLIHQVVIEDPEEKFHEETNR
ncbi:MAG TPA: hydrogenase maturation nickel metallochaperone HypA [Calditrichia bacterium]|nr:hydrogenase maturation nickel metallochaperone HypA [Calditrichota bacterium]HQU70955.1 hydrogenase maturation nickel metallochaperone HypA [Calditrichia bacterium]HQV33749.1 hydrogenase maturation nickel metallochaperone HypA [Calditrichia bacterium]